MHNLKELRKNLENFKKKFKDRNVNFDINTFQDKDNLNRDLTSTEANAKKKLIELYGSTELNKIYDIYKNVNDEEVLCFMINKSNDYNLYKFLY